MSEARYRITSGHPIYPVHVEDTWNGHEPEACFGTYDEAAEWVRTASGTEPTAWRLAYIYPEVCRAHAEFGGSDQLEDWLRQYHAAVIAERNGTRPSPAPMR